MEVQAIARNIRISPRKAMLRVLTGVSIHWFVIPIFFSI